MRHLGGAVQLEDAAGSVIAANAAARLERDAGMAAGGELELDDEGRRAQGRVHVAVALAEDGHLRVAAGHELARLGVGREQDGQLLDLHGHEIGGVLGGIGVVREHRRHRLADIAHLLAREHGLPIGLEGRNASLAKINRRQVDDVGRGPDRHHPRHGARRSGVDGDDVAVGVARAHHAHMELVRE